MEYMLAPWRPDRWRAHCSEVIARYWDNKLKKKAESMTSLCMLDVANLSIIKPAKVWAMAGLDSTEVRKAAIVNWMTLGVYQTRETLFKMKVIKSPLCKACSMNAIGSLAHYMLYFLFTESCKSQLCSKVHLYQTRK